MSDTVDSVFGEAMSSVERWNRRLQPVLEDASMLGLCGKPFDELERALQHDIDQDRDLYAGRQDDLAKERRKSADDLDAQIADIDRRIEESGLRSKQRQKLEGDATAIEDQIIELDGVIRQKRRKCQAEKLKAKLDEIDAQDAAAHEQLSTEQRRRDEQHLKLWQSVVDQFNNASVDAQKRIDEAETELSHARDRAEPLLKKGVTRTVAGFLLWSGYLSFAAIGSAFAILFHDSGEKQSGLNHVLGIARGLLQAFPNNWTLAVRLALGSLLIVAGLVAFCGLVMLLDRTLKRFDRGWRADARRRVRNANRREEAQSQFIVRPPGAATEIRRSAYVQLLASAPYILITAVITLFAAAAAPFGTATPQGVPASADEAAATTATTFIGTVLALLITASFVMYILKVLDPREREGGNATAKRRWTDGWEFLVVPVLLVVTTLCATFRVWPPTVWGPAMLVMLLSCLAVAYGVIYSGIYKDITILERRKRHFVEELAELRDWSPPDPDETDEMRSARAIIEELRHRREELLTAEWDAPLVSAPEALAPQQSGFAFFKKADAAQPRPRIKYQEIAVTDDEAAPEEYRERRRLQRDLREVERQQRELVHGPADDIPALQERRARAEQEKSLALASVERADFETRRSVAEFDQMKALWLVKLRTAYEAAALTSPFLRRGLGEV